MPTWLVREFALIFAFFIARVLPRVMRKVIFQNLRKKAIDIWVSAVVAALSI